MRTYANSERLITTKSVAAVSPREDRPRHGYLYMVSINDGEYIKIGITRDPAKRFAELQRGLPEELLPGACFVLKDYDVWEKVLHRRYREYRRWGEWFRMPDYVFSWLWRDLGVLERWEVRLDMRAHPEEYLFG